MGGTSLRKVSQVILASRSRRTRCYIPLRADGASSVWALCVYLMISFNKALWSDAWLRNLSQISRSPNPKSWFITHLRTFTVFHLPSLQSSMTCPSEGGVFVQRLDPRGGSGRPRSVCMGSNVAVEIFRTVNFSTEIEVRAIGPSSTFRESEVHLLSS